MVVLGNKADLNAIRQVKDETVKVWSRSNGIRPYEVSVANRDGLKDPFCYLAWRMANPSECGVGVVSSLSSPGCGAVYLGVV